MPGRLRFQTVIVWPASIGACHRPTHNPQTNKAKTHRSSSYIYDWGSAPDPAQGPQGSDCMHGPESKVIIAPRSDDASTSVLPRHASRTTLSPNSSFLLVTWYLLPHREGLHAARNTVKQLWREGKVAVGGWLAINSSYCAEIMAHADFDWLVVDTQHGAIDFNSALAMLQAISTTDTMPFARVPWNEPSIIMKMLDAGAYGGIVVPMIETKADAEAAVRACRFPPVGLRSAGPYRGVLYGGSDYTDKANDEIALILMIETPQALENLEEIALSPVSMRCISARLT